MHQLRKSLLVLVSGLAACGAPAELDDSLFPAPGNTGYDRTSGNVGGSSPGIGGSASLGGSASFGGSASPGTGGSGAPAPGQGGSGNAAQGGSGQAPGQGGSGNAAQGGSGAAPVGAGGNAPIAGSAGDPSGGSGSGGGDCPDDITVLFDRPGGEGGCAGGGCHIPGGTPPDLVSPNPEQRLVGVMSSAVCGSVPYVSSGGSLLEDKIVGSPPSCGSAMPFLSPQALNAEDEQCILDWIAEVSGG